MTLAKRLTETVAGLAVVGGLVAGCADGSNPLTTSSLAPGQTAAATPKIDPACVALTARIDALRKEGVAERIEKVSTGKSATVSVRRDSLAKMTELDKANAEFQAKCTPMALKPAQTAAAAPAPAPAQPAAQLAPAAPAAAKK